MKTENTFFVECEVTFLHESEGGPSQGFWPKNFQEYSYRPCIAFGDPNQRAAKLVSKDVDIELEDGTKTSYRSDKFIDEPYYGIAFKEGPDNPEQGQPFTAVISPFSQGEADVERFQIGSTFTLREGARIVGYGRVLRTFYGPT